MNNLTVYVKPNGECPYCERAIEILTQNNIPHTIRETEKHAMLALCEEHGIRDHTYPQVIDHTNSIVIGGYEDVKAKFQEEILQPSPNKYTMFPVKYTDIFNLYEKAVASFWTTSELNLSLDLADFEKLTANEQHFIKYILAFFASSDAIVAENLVKNFCDEIKNNESRAFLLYQGFNESIHQHTYSLLIDTYIQDTREKEMLFNAIETIPTVKQKAIWAFKWMDRSQPFANRLVAFAIVEGVFFSGSFCAIFWLKKRGLMPGLSFSNVLIARDEGMHVEHAVLVFKHLKNKPSSDMVKKIIKDAVEHEVSFITESLPCALIGMNSNEMTEYIMYVADRLLLDLGYSKMYHSQNPFPFMESISLEGKTNFFEKRVGEYQKAGVRSRREDQAFSTEADF